MRATVVDMRYHMNDVLKALDRHEQVSVLFRGRVKGILRSADVPVGSSVKAHPFFGSDTGRRPVAKIMDDLRGGRVRDL